MRERAGAVGKVDRRSVGMIGAICHHQLPRSHCMHCMHAELELLRAERQQLRVAVYEALHALLQDDLGGAAVALCRVTEDA